MLGMTSSRTPAPMLARRTAGRRHLVKVNAFGNALGSSLADAMQSAPDQSEAETARLNRYEGAALEQEAASNRTSLNAFNREKDAYYNAPSFESWPDQTGAESSRLNRYEGKARAMENFNTTTAKLWAEQDAKTARKALAEQHASADAFRREQEAARQQAASVWTGGAGGGRGFVNSPANVNAYAPRGHYETADSYDAFSGVPTGGTERVWVSDWPAMSYGDQMGRAIPAAVDLTVFGPLKGLVNGTPEMAAAAVKGWAYTGAALRDGFDAVTGGNSHNYLDQAIARWDSPSGRVLDYSNGFERMGGFAGEMASPALYAKVTSMTYVAAQDQAVSFWLHTQIDDIEKINAVYTSAADGTRRLGYSFDGLFGYRSANNETAAFRRGEFMSLERPSNPADAIERNALSPNWGNEATDLYQVKTGSGFYFKGQVAPQSGVYETGPLKGTEFYLGGGSTQIFKPTTELPSGELSAPWVNSVKVRYGG